MTPFNLIFCLLVIWKTSALKTQFEKVNFITALKFTKYPRICLEAIVLNLFTLSMLSTDILPPTPPPHQPEAPIKEKNTYFYKIYNKIFPMNWDWIFEPISKNEKNGASCSLQFLNWLSKNLVSYSVMELGNDHKSYFLIPRPLQSDGVNLWCFNLFDPTLLIVWNIKGLRHQVATI